MNKDPVYIGKREVHQIRKFVAKYNTMASIGGSDFASCDPF